MPSASFREFGEYYTTRFLPCVVRLPTRWAGGGGAGGSRLGCVGVGADAVEAVEHLVAVLLHGVEGVEQGGVVERLPGDEVEDGVGAVVHAGVGGLQLAVV